MAEAVDEEPCSGLPLRVKQFDSVTLSIPKRRLHQAKGRGVGVPSATETHRFQGGVGESRPGSPAPEQPSLCGLEHSLALSDLDFPSGKV